MMAMTTNNSIKVKARGFALRVSSQQDFIGPPTALASSGSSRHFPRGCGGCQTGCEQPNVDQPASDRDSVEQSNCLFLLEILGTDPEPATNRPRQLPFSFT
jgi:hypothetical protein